MTTIYQSTPTYSTAELWAWRLRQRQGAHRNLVPGEVPAGSPWAQRVGPSIAVFQLGETGGGDHLRSAVTAADRLDLLPALELFLEEENEHARLLGLIVDELGADRLEAHWTDTVFSWMRRLSGGWTELAALLTAEVAGHTFYRAMAAQAPTEGMAAVFSAIADDEALHLDFVADMLIDLMAPWSGWRKRLAVTGFVVGAYAVAAAFAFSHASALRPTHPTPWGSVAACHPLIADLGRTLRARRRG